MGDFGIDLGGAMGAAGGIWANAKNMEFAEEMASTQYQRAVADMKAAGLNPMAVFGSGGGSPASSPGGQATNPMSSGSPFTGGSVQSLLGISQSASQTRESAAKADAAESAAEIAASNASVLTKENSAMSKALDTEWGKTAAVADKYGKGHKGPLGWLIPAGAATGYATGESPWGGVSSAMQASRDQARADQATEQRKFESEFKGAKGKDLERLHQLNMLREHVGSKF